MQLFKQQTAMRFMGHRLILAMGLSGNLMIVSAGLAQSTDSIGVAVNVPKNTVITTVTVGNDPSGIVVSPDSKTAYVVNYQSSSVSVLDATNGYAVKATASVAAYPGDLAISPDGTTLYVSCWGNPGIVDVVDTTQPTYPVKTTLTAGAYPNGLAVTPDGKALYIANRGDPYESIQGTVSVFNTSTYKLTTITTPGNPLSLVFTNQGKQADVLNTGGTGYLQFIHTVSGQISSLTAAGGQIFFPRGIVSDRSATTLYITSEYNYVTVCNARTGNVTNQFLVSPNIDTEMDLGQPAATPNGEYVYVPYAFNVTAAENVNQVAMFDVGTGKIVGTPIPTGKTPTWAQMAPNGRALYVANAGDGTVTVIDTAP